MRDMTPGGVRHAANRTEIRLREADRSARRTADMAAAAARGNIAYSEGVSANLPLTTAERIILPAIVAPVEPGRLYRVKSTGMLWIDGTTPFYGNLHVRMLLSSEGGTADLTSPILDMDRVYAPPGGYGVRGHTERTVPAIDTDQYQFLSVTLTAVVSSSRTGGVHGGSSGYDAPRLWIFDDGVSDAAEMTDVIT